MHKNLLLILAGALFVVLVLVYAVLFLRSSERQRSPEELVQVILESTDPVEQEKAAVELAGLGEPALEHMRRVLAESKSDVVRGAAIRGLGSQFDYESMESLLDAMTDPSPLVRGPAGAAAQNMVGADFGFTAGAPPEKRERAIADIRGEWEIMRASPESLEQLRKRMCRHK